MKTCTRNVIICFAVIVILTGALVGLYFILRKRQNTTQTPGTELTKLSGSDTETPSGDVTASQRAEQLLRQLLVSR